MESASWQRPLHGFEISQNQAKMSLKSGFSDGLGGVSKKNRFALLFKKACSFVCAIVWTQDF